ncbi:MAG TPA: hypothetical protein VIF62_33965 [Labilithrix sp.]|jgi:hypothetical protein
MNDVLHIDEPTRALETRIIILEAALAAIGRECETALDEPTMLFMTACRVAALARQALAKPKRARARTDAEAPQSNCA